MRIAAVFLAILLAAPFAGAQSPDPLFAEVISTHDTYQIDGQLGAIRLNQHGSSEVPSPLNLFLHAPSLTVLNLTRGGIEAGGSITSDSRIESMQFSDATVLENEGRQSRDISIHPLNATVEVKDRTATFTPSDQEEVEGSNFVTVANHRLSSLVEDSVRIQSPSPTVTIRGDFIVSLWEYDVRVLSDGQQVDVSSGQTESLRLDTYSPNGMATIPGPSTHNTTEVHLEVTGGTLRLTLGSGNVDLFVTEPNAQFQSADLFGVSGVLPRELGGFDAHGETLQLAGDILLGFNTQAGRLLWNLGGSIDSASLDGSAIAVTTPVAGGRIFQSWLPVATTATIVGLAAVGFVPLYRHNAQRRLEDAELLFAAGHFNAAADMAKPRPMAGVTDQAAALQIQSLLHAGRVEEAKKLSQSSNISERRLKGFVELYVGDWEGTS